MTAIIEATGPTAASLVSTPIDKLEKLALQSEIEDLIPENIFSDKTYTRAVLMRASKPCIIGHKHKTTHTNVVMTGRALVSIDGEVRIIEAPYVFESKAGVRKSLYILEDMIWLTIHPNEDDERDIEKLEERFIEKTGTFKDYVKERETLLNAVKEEESE